MYWDIFTCFAKVGAFTIGGGYAMIPIIEREVVDKRNWITAEDFTDVVAISQSAPGLLAVNISIFIGYRLKGVKGSIIASLGCIIAPFLIMLLIATVFTDFKDNPVVERIFKGIRPVVVALIGVPMMDMFKATKMRWWSWCIWIASMVLVCLLSVSPIYILICVIVVAAFISWYNNRKAV